MELNNHFSKRDLVKLMSLSHRSLTCRDIAEFKSLLVDLKELFYYENAMCAQADIRAIIRSDQKNLNMNVCNVSFPSEYLDLYLNDMNFLKDAAFQKFISNLAPVNWPLKNDKGRLPCEVLTAAMDFELKSGWLHGMPAPDADRITVFGFAGPFSENGEKISKALEYIIPFYTETYYRIRRQPPPPSFNLTRKEKDVLNWIKEGKSSWEISVLLKCSKRTIDFHVNNIKLKLNVVSRAQAVATALHYGVISF